MNKHYSLWEYIQKSSEPRLSLTFEKIVKIAGIPIDHFLKYKKDLSYYGYEVR